MGYRQGGRPARVLLAAAGAILLANLAACPALLAGTFTWDSTTGNWSDAARWGGTSPTGTNNTDILRFNGAGSVSYTSTNDVATVPFVLNQIVLNSTAAVTNSVGGNSIQFAGAAPTLTQSGSGSFNVDNNLNIAASTSFGGTGAGSIFLTGTITVSAGTLTMASTNYVPSGSFNVADGTTLSVSNTTGPSVLRSAPVNLNTTGSLVKSGANANVVVGGLTGGGTVNVGGGSLDMFLLTNATSSAAITAGGAGLTVSGVATQTLSGTTSALNGTITLNGTDLGSGQTSAGLKLSGSAGLTAGSVTLALQGGTLTLDNTAGNADRFRNAGGATIVGGGGITLIGNSAGSQESIGALNLHCGSLAINVTNNGGATGTELNFASLTEDATNQGTMNVVATGGTLGSASGPRVTLTAAPSLTNGVIGPGSGWGFVTVNGTDHATYVAGSGVVPVTIDATVNGALTTANTSNVLLNGNATMAAGNITYNTIKVQPTAAGQSLDLTGAGNLTTGSILLAGSTDFTIRNTGTGTGHFAGGSDKYFQIWNPNTTLFVGVTLNGVAQPIVKVGDGFMALTGTTDQTPSAQVIINGGTFRSSLTSFPNNKSYIEFRGGVFEVDGGGTLSRTLGSGNGKIDWDNGGTDRGNGGFSAINGNATVTIQDATWGQGKFIQDGFALVFGSTKADSRVDYTSGIGLDNGTAGAYNARVIRTIDNPNVTTDVARISGVISGSVNSDLVKTGTGMLELTAANTYGGRTAVTAGTLLVSNTSGSGTGTGNVQIYTSGTLAGTGTVSGRVSVNSGGTVAPGPIASPGILTVGNNVAFSAGSAFAVRLNASTVGTGYGQLVANGSLDLGSANLIVNFLNGYNPANGDKDFIINKTSSGPITNTFSGLPEGSTINFAAYSAQISYRGDFPTGTVGSGNDVVLYNFTPVPEPTHVVLVCAAGTAALSWLRRRFRSHSAAV
jgi:autotransporter-associated beta strand protein